MKLFKKYLTIFLIAAKSSFYFRNRIITQGLIQSFRIGLLAAVYSFVYQSVNVKGETTVQMAVWSIAAYFTFLSIRFKNLFEDINNDIKLGNIEILLSRPINYLAYRIVNQIGSDIFSLVIPALFCAFFLPSFVGLPQVELDLVYVLGILLIAIFGMIVGALLYAVIGFAAFWLEDAYAVYWIIDKFVMLLGGAYLPIVFFPEWVKTFVYSSPFGASMFISHIFYADFKARLPWLLLVQLIWIVLLLLFNIFVFAKAKKRLVVNGG